MRRKIVTINESLCDGCKECITACSEGALEIVDGKAKLIKEVFCDGFGDCIGNCPTGALVIEERESVPFDEEATKQHLFKTQGSEAVKKMEKVQKMHIGDNGEKLTHISCPGSAMREMRQNEEKPISYDSTVVVNVSELRQWPIQIHLVQPGAPFFKNKELVVMNTCGPFASADVHWRYLRGRGVVVGCPKLDNTQPYPGKLGMILQDSTIPKVIVVRMEVPCCGGLTQIVGEAVRLSRRDNIIMQEDTINIDGSITSRILYQPE